MKLTLVYHGSIYLPPFYVLLHRRSDDSPVGGHGSAQDVKEWLESDKVEPLDENFNFTEVSELVLTARDVSLSSDKVVFMDENDPTEQTPDILTSSSKSSHPFDSILHILGKVKGGNLRNLTISRISTFYSCSVMPTNVIEEIVSLVGSNIVDLKLEGYSVLPEGICHLQLPCCRNLHVKDLIDLDHCIDADAMGSFDSLDTHELMMEPGGEYPGAEQGLDRPPCFYEEEGGGIGADLWPTDEEQQTKRCIRPYTRPLMNLAEEFKRRGAKICVDLYNDDRGMTTRRLCLDGWAFEVLTMEDTFDMLDNDEEIKYGEFS
ncbi:hypothetical protein TrRE_jg7608 [Triparma retinervis]|uniref:Uncharacterized protein n=1 Tax=Triparma retinervis TaxID=2557542 RepID=A0A9W6ZW42_9STRA|nr:hypothetical protein TrRE_jg7608 [Triparma retinervis]